MKQIFVDTSALIAIGNKRDQYHSQAVKINNELKKSKNIFVITSAILLEFGNAFASTNLKPTAIKIIETINRSEKWRCINANKELVERGFQKFKKYQDKDWGLVDCINMIVANELGITEIFTSDYHFEQAGFSILIK